MLVMARRRGGERFSPGTITDTEGDRVQVRFEGGGEEWTTAAALALPLPPPSPQAPPEPAMPPIPDIVKPGWEPRTVLWVGVVVLVAVAVLFYLLGKR
jgi:hypothetical protein